MSGKTACGSEYGSNVERWCRSQHYVSVYSAGALFRLRALP